MEWAQEFVYVEPSGTDQGVNVRHKAKAVFVLLTEPGELHEKRARCASPKLKP